MATEIDYSWVPAAACAGSPLNDFFVEAGRVAKPSVLKTCKTCPVRKECTLDAYTNEFATGGYRGGFSPSQRRRIPLEAALAIAADESDRFRAENN